MICWTYFDTHHTPRNAGKTDAVQGDQSSKDGIVIAMIFRARRVFAASLLATLSTSASWTVWAQETPTPAATASAPLSEPVYRLSKAEPSQGNVAVPHALDPAIRLAYESLGIIQANVHDYTAKLVKRERIGDTLGEHEYMFTKIRNRKVENNQVVVPFSVYLAFLKPAEVKGREVIYVENQNEGRVVAHEGGLKRMLGTHMLEPNGWLARQGQRYPITDVGLTNLVTKLIERAERDKQVGDCKVQFFEGAKVSSRPCTVIQVEHPEKIGPYDFHIAQVFLDNEYRLPVRYAAYTWPTAQGGEPELLEEYTYQDIKFNVGLSDTDFDATNPEYAFHKK
jgi:hypothetical protein